MVDHPKRADLGAGCRRRLAAAIVAALALASTGVTATATAAGLVGARAAHLAATQPPIEATDVSVENEPASAKIVFDLTGTAVPGAFVLADPDRAIVDLPQTTFRMSADAGHLDAGRPDTGRGRRGRHPGLVKSFRFGLLSAGRSRIVVDLASPAKLSATVTAPVPGQSRARLVIALTRTDRAAFRAASRGGALAASAASQPAPTPAPADAGKATIVLDPGHGGPDTGAIANGVLEKQVTLAFAQALAAKLRAAGGFDVVMTRSSDVFIPLSERVRIARAAGAALMVSIHADTLTESADVSGATVYTVSDKASDAYAAKVAAKENSSDEAVGVDGQPDTAEVNDILFDLTRQETRAYSHVFARTLVNYWKVAGRLNKNPQRAAGFVVLKAPDVPSVLLELGYLSNAADSAALTSDDWRDKATGRMADAIVAYFADRRGPAKAAAGVPIPLRQATAETGGLTR